LSRDEPPERRAFGIGHLIAGHWLAKDDACGIYTVLDRVAEGRWIIVTDRPSPATRRAKQVVARQRRRKGCRRRRANVAIDASGRPGRQGAIVVAQVCGQGMLSVEDCTPQAGGFARAQRVGKTRHRDKSKTDCRDSRRAVASSRRHCTSSVFETLGTPFAFRAKSM
jgi:hypothetical protein